MGTLKMWLSEQNKPVLVLFLVCWVLTIGWGAFYVLHFSGSVSRAAVVAAFTTALGVGALYGDWRRWERNERNAERRRERRKREETVTRVSAIGRTLLSGRNPPEIRHHGGHITLLGMRFTATYPDGRSEEGFVTDGGQVLLEAQEAGGKDDNGQENI